MPPTTRPPPACPERPAPHPPPHPTLFRLPHRVQSLLQHSLRPTPSPHHARGTPHLPTPAHTARDAPQLRPPHPPDTGTSRGCSMASPRLGHRQWYTCLKANRSSGLGQTHTVATAPHGHRQRHACQWQRARTQALDPAGSGSAGTPVCDVHALAIAPRSPRPRRTSQAQPRCLAAVRRALCLTWQRSCPQQSAELLGLASGSHDALPTHHDSHECWVSPAVVSYHDCHMM